MNGQNKKCALKYLEDAQKLFSLSGRNDRVKNCSDKIFALRKNSLKNMASQKEIYVIFTIVTISSVILATLSLWWLKMKLQNLFNS